MYDAFDANAMVIVMLYRWPYNKVDAYINTRHAQVDAI